MATTCLQVTGTDLGLCAAPGLVSTLLGLHVL